MTTPFYDDIMKTIARLERAPADPRFVAMLEQWRLFFGALANVTDPLVEAAELGAALAGMQGDPDPRVKLKIVQAASRNPVLGPSFVLASLPALTARWAGRFWQGLYVEEVAKPTPDPNPHSDVQLSAPFDDWVIKSLPPPGPGRKYLIFSDVHRDDASDHREPLGPGTIQHFQQNAALFARILDHYGADGSGYTILEGGDCEELWFIRSVDGDGASVAPYPMTPSGELDVAAKLGSIIATHQGLYDRLRRLHAQGRYFRIQGNHDSWVRSRPPHDGSVFAVLEQAMTAGNPAAPFRIYDACVIPGVKTMCDESVWKLLGDAWRVRSGTLEREVFINGLIQSQLGLDAGRYTDKAKMIVAHGHQFDFWNCEGNELAGMLISNTAATFLDRHMDPIVELRGVAWQGNPVIDFEDIFARLSVFSGWPVGHASVELAHRIQHQPNGERELTDDIFFLESVVALWAAFGIALKGPDSQGVERTPAASRAALDLREPAQILQYLQRHHGHHVCIGHTHAPHSQPYYTLDNVATLLPPPFSWLVRALRALLPDLLEPAFKTLYSNSGTAGWMEGVIWATEIDETGQSRLVFWTEKTRVETPERMDWELEPLDPRVRDHLLEAYRKALDAPGAELSGNLATLIQKLRKRLGDLQVAADALNSALAHTIVLPVHLLAITLLERGRPPEPAPRVLMEIRQELLRQIKSVGRRLRRQGPDLVNEALDRAVDALREQLRQLQQFSADVVLSVRRRLLHGFAAIGEADILTLYAPIAPAAVEGVRVLQRLLQDDAAAGSPGDRDDAALHHAALAFAAFDGFPRNLPYFSNRSGSASMASRVVTSEQPVLQAMLASLWMFPVAGQPVTVGGVTLWSRVRLVVGDPRPAAGGGPVTRAPNAPSFVKLVVKIGAAGVAEPMEEGSAALVS